MKPVKYTFEVKQTATLRIDVVGYDIVHAQERIALCRNQQTTKIVERRIDCFGNEYYVEVER